jgi:predicted TIM-barrel fold metal-dependent hydrolase
MAQLPDDMMLFSSDFPHFEGFAKPREHYAAFFARHPERNRDAFMSGNALKLFERMGDPLDVGHLAPA